MLNQNTIISFVNKTIPSLKDHDNVGTARQTLSKSTFQVLPVTQNGLFLNFIKHDDLVKMKKNTLLKNCIPNDENIPKLFENTRVDQAVAVFLNKDISHLNILPVINHELHFIGCIEKISLFESILRELRFEDHVYSVKILIPSESINPLSTFFLLLEKQNIQILSTLIYREINQTQFTLTLTCESTLLDDLKMLLIRSRYKIIESTPSLREIIMTEGLKDRIDGFLRMMDV